MLLTIVKKKDGRTTPVMFLLLSDLFVYLDLSINSADIAIARMNTVIATKINATASSNPPEMLPIPDLVVFSAQ